MFDCFNTFERFDLLICLNNFDLIECFIAYYFELEKLQLFI